MKKILIIFTGGTIGSRINNATIDVDASAGMDMLQMFMKQCDKGISFEVIQPMNILSENCNPADWQILYDTMKGLSWKAYAGIIITHGSDTLPYTSALISFLFHDVMIPVVITGSNYTLGRKESNGFHNFSSAVDFVCHSGLHGVYAIFQNNKGKNKVFLATRIQEADSYQDQFVSFGGVDLGEMHDDKLKLHRNVINPTKKILAKRSRRIIGEDIVFRNSITAIKPYPGLNYMDFQFQKKPSAILHGLYHSGTGCTRGEPYSLPVFVKKCLDMGIDFYIISLKNIESDLYITSREILKNGAVPLQNISFEAAYAKLHIAYNQNTMSPREYMHREIFYEFLPR